MEKVKVPFLLEQNGDGSWAIIENPDSENMGSKPWIGEKVVRSPFTSREEARAREEEIAEYWDYTAILID